MQITDAKNQPKVKFFTKIRKIVECLKVIATVLTRKIYLQGRILMSNQ